MIEQGTQSSLRLVFEYAKRYGFDLLTDEQVISLIMKSYNFESSNARLDENFTPRNASYYHFSEYPVDKILELLKNIRKSIFALDIGKFDYNHETVKNINDLIITLIQRYTSNSQKTIDSLIFYKSISIFYKFYTSIADQATSEFLVDYFQRNPKERLYIQKHCLGNPPNK